MRKVGSLTLLLSFGFVAGCSFDFGRNVFPIWDPNNFDTPQTGNGGALTPIPLPGKITMK